MASIEGIKPGFVPQAAAEVKAPPLDRAYREEECFACGFVRSARARKGAFVEDDDEEKYCQGCAQHFGLHEDVLFGSSMSLGMGSTHDPHSAKEKLARIKIDDWAIVLNTQKFASAKTGRGLTVEFGDAFKIIRVGKARPGNGTWRDTQLMFTIDVQFGQETITLHMHEFAPISFLEMIQLKGTGDYEEQFLEQNDDWGYFQPSPENREMIKATFGDR